ncbi:hypothetical protein ACFPIK_15455 [Algoriphagus aquatilis]|uniref:Carboxypeptidase regulatory-like domain-containing protein n=1 Tax=Algoriphagus aquatilis TaxID=490186 RepID=A0ABW0BYY4_9BACT
MRSVVYFSAFIIKTARLLCFLGFAVFFSERALAQQEPDGEALLTLSHPGIGQFYVNAAFFGDVAYLPLGEILSLTEIPNESTENKSGYQGFYPEKKDTWKIDPSSGFVIIKGVSETLPADKFYKGELDLFIHPEYFRRIFGLEFTVNSFSLTLSLKSERPLPVEEKKKREALRSRALAKGGPQANLNMLYPRDRKIFGFGVIDYALNHDRTKAGSNTAFQMRGGGEFLGGDVQGAVTGALRDGRMVADFSGLRWRYVLPAGLKPEKNVLLSSITLGQITTTSQTNGVSLTGFSLSNNPIIPRQELDVFVIDGYTEKDSEVELLIGGQLVDFMRADEVGYYRFNAPVTYGTVRLTLRIYTPQGEVIVQDRQLQIPFTFLPKGFVAYNIQGGQLMSAPEFLNSDLAGHADVAVGISNALTVNAGLDYGEVFGEQKQYTSFGLSSRLFQQYLLNIEAQPDRFYRANASVFYANNVNLTGQFTEYVPPKVENTLREQPLKDANVNVFIPFKLFGRFSGIRFGGQNTWFQTGYRGNVQSDFNVQVGRVTTRFNYRAQVAGTRSETNLPPEFASGNLTTSMTYSLPRSPSLPVFVKGMFIRAQAVYNTQSSKINAVNVQVSQTLFKQGRFNFGYNYNVANNSGQMQIGFLYDFQFVRSSSQYSTQQGGNYSLRQSLSGSLALDPASTLLVPSNRDQLGRSGLTVRMFVDQNENGKYDKGEEIVPAKAVRLDKSGNMLLGSDGLLRISQLQSYWTYRLEVDINALPDPTLAPKEKVFGFVAEPNRYKVIEIPLYRTGTMEGTVLIDRGSGVQGVGGLRLMVQREGDPEPLETIRTFSDGSFYAIGLLPGKYKLVIDPKQLEFLKAKANPEVLEFEIKALADGDYLEGLEILLVVDQE